MTKQDLERKVNALEATNQSLSDENKRLREKLERMNELTYLIQQQQYPLFKTVQTATIMNQSCFFGEKKGTIFGTLFGAIGKLDSMKIIHSTKMLQDIA